MSAQLEPAHIMQVGMGFWGSKTLLSAVELELFTKLGEREMTGPQIADELGLHQRAVPDFPDALVALGFLERDGEGVDARYRNTQETTVFLNKKSPAYVGGILEMANTRLYPFWADLTEGLRTGRPQNEAKHGAPSIFDELYSDPDRPEQFIQPMAGIPRGPSIPLEAKSDFSNSPTLS